MHFFICLQQKAYIGNLTKKESTLYLDDFMFCFTNRATVIYCTLFIRYPAKYLHDEAGAKYFRGRKRNAQKTFYIFRKQESERRLTVYFLLDFR